MKTLILFSTLTLLFISCKKEGCTNENAANYDSEAKKDDESCKYEAQASFWFNEEVSDEFIGSELRVSINGSIVGTMDPGDWKTGPDCGGDNFTAVIELEGNSSESFTYALTNNYGMYLYEGTIQLAPNDCISTELPE